MLIIRWIRFQEFTDLNSWKVPELIINYLNKLDNNWLGKQIFTTERYIAVLPPLSAVGGIAPWSSCTRLIFRVSAEIVMGAGTSGEITTVCLAVRGLAVPSLTSPTRSGDGNLPSIFKSFDGLFTVFSYIWKCNQWARMNNDYQSLQQTNRSLYKWQ
jgi:hypothetical protein